LQRIQANGVRRQLVGIEISGSPLEGPNTRFWPLMANGDQVGVVTSAIYSPRLGRNIALAMIESDWSALGSQVEVCGASGNANVTVVEIPFVDPKKALAKTSGRD